MNIRLEEEKDYREVELLTREAFYNLYVPGCDEHYVVHTMRKHPDFMKDLSFVAELDGRIVGSILYTRSTAASETGVVLHTATFGPLCVHPEYQRKGIGTALIEHTKKLLIERGFPALVILGDPHNYCKHGFRTGHDLGVSMADGTYPLGLLVLELQKDCFAGSRWRFQESSLYEVDPKAAAEYDATLPPREKKKQYSQELFSMMSRAVIPE